MTDTTEPTEAPGWDRRRFIKASAGGAALVWAAPTITGLNARAFAAGSDPDCPPLFDMNIDNEMLRTSASGAVGNLLVSPGNVDVIGNDGSTAFFDFLPGNGVYLDLDGTGSSNPVVVSTNGAVLLAGTTYRVSITLAGANTSGGGPGSADDNAAEVTVGGTTFATFDYDQTVGFTTTVIFVTPTVSGPLVIEHQTNTDAPSDTTGDNVGMLLKDLVIQPAQC
jgi:hypothetical protein